MTVRPASESPSFTPDPTSAPARRIVVIEDERDMAEAIAARFRSEGFAVSVAFDGPSGVATCHDIEPDAVVLDVNLPGFDGLEVCRQIQRERSVPIIMLTARDSEMDLLVGLAVGADDYLTKPFSQRELVARVHALIRRSSVGVAVSAAGSASPIPGGVPGEMTAPSGDGPSGTGLASGFDHLGVHLDLLNRTVDLRGRPIHLTVTEFDLSHWFLRHPRVVFTREQLLRSVWGYADGSGERTVDSHVQAVRKKLGPEFVRTVHGVGYSLGFATVERTDGNGTG